MAPTLSRPIQSGPEQIETINGSHKYVKRVHQLLQTHGFNYSIDELVKILTDVVELMPPFIFFVWVKHNACPNNPVQLPFNFDMFLAVFRKFSATFAVQRLGHVLSSLFFLAKGNPIFQSIPGFANNSEYQKQNMKFFLVFMFQYLIVYSFMVPSIANKPIFNGLLQNPIEMDKFKKHLRQMDDQLPTLFFLLKDMLVFFWVTQFTEPEYFYEEHSVSSIDFFIQQTDVMQEVHTELVGNLMKFCDVCVVSKRSFIPKLPLLFRFDLAFVDDDEIHDKKQTALAYIESSKNALAAIFPHMKHGLDMLTEPKNGKFLECDELHSIKQNPAYNGKMICI